MLSHSVMPDSATAWTVAHQPPFFTGILQARMLEWAAISSCRVSSQPRNRTHVSHIAGGFFTIWATREAPTLIWKSVIVHTVPSSREKKKIIGQGFVIYFCYWLGTIQHQYYIVFIIAWCWEGWRAGGEGGNRGWDAWMGSLTQWTWVWANSRR